VTNASGLRNEIVLRVRVGHRRFVMRAETRRLAFLLSLAVLLPAFFAVAASAQGDPYMEVDAYPDTVPVQGETVRFTVDVVVSEPDRPATVIALTSVTFGDVADAENPALSSTECSVPTEYAGTPGFRGMACTYQVSIEGAPGELTDTVSATIGLADGTEITVSDTVSVTISTQLGAIRGALVDAVTGFPLPGVFVWGTCQGCGDFTGSDGTFSFQGVEPGEYRLRSGSASPGGWAPTAPESYRTEYAYEWYDEEPTGPSEVEAGTVVAVLPGESVEVQWRLSLGGSIEGKVTSTDGNPIPILDASFWITDPSGLALPHDSGGYADFSADGTYRFHGLRSGGYVVCVELVDGSQCWADYPKTEVGPPVEGDVIAVVLGETTAGIDFVIETPHGNGEEAGDGDATGNGAEPTLPFTGIDSVLFLLTGLGLLASGMATLIFINRTPSSPG
jgi:hypothetical protein